MLKPVSSEPLGRPRAVSNYFFGPQDRPRPLQELSKSAPRPLQEPFSRPRCFKRPLGSNLTPIWTSFWTPFGRKNHFHEVCRRQSAAIADIVEETTHSTITSNYLRGLSSGSWGRRGVSNYLFGSEDRPRPAQDRSKSSPRVVQDRSKRSSAGQEASRGLWGAI